MHLLAPCAFLHTEMTDFPSLSYTPTSEIPSYWQNNHAQGMDSH